MPISGNGGTGGHARSGWFMVGHAAILGWRPDQHKRPIGAVTFRLNTLES